MLLQAWLSLGVIGFLTTNTYGFHTLEGSYFQAQLRPSTTTNMSRREREIGQALVKKALQAFPNVGSLRTVKAHGITRPRASPMPPRQPVRFVAHHSLSSADNLLLISLSDVSIVVSGGGSESRRRKHRRSGHTGRSRTPCSAPTSCQPRPFPVLTRSISLLITASRKSTSPGP